jgi:outer membrane biosynthesis protein TonB
MHTSTRKKRNQAPVNLVISVVFHTLIVVAIIFFAAREGILGEKLKTIAVTMVPKEKPPEKPKEKPPEEKPPERPEPEKPKATPAPVVAPPKLANTVVPPPAAVAAAAPAAAALPAFNFSDGAKVVQTTSDPHLLYKGYVENILRSKWAKPNDIADEGFVAEIELALDRSGRIVATDWKHGTGDNRWDDSVRRVFDSVKTVGRTPPDGFPGKFLVRFDAVADSEPLESGIP